MGTSYYVCSICGEAFPDGWDGWVSCDEGCDKMFCGQCVEKYNIEWNEDDEDAPAKNCPICSNKVILDEQIIEYCLKKLSQDRDTIIQKIKDEIKLGVGE